MNTSNAPLVALISLPLLSALSGCSALVVPLPPPSPSIVSLDPVAAGDVEVGAGLNGSYFGEENDLGTFQIPNYLGGSSPAHVAIGLSDRLTLTGTYGAWAFGNNTGAGLGISLAQGEMGGLSALVGSGLYLHRQSHTEEIVPVDEAGEPIPDAEPETKTTRYAYFGIAPNVGLQGYVNLGEHLRWLSMARVSYSQTFGLYGLDRDDQRGMLYAEATTGLQYEVLDNLDLGVGVHGMWVDSAPAVGGTISASGTFKRRR